MRLALLMAVLLIAPPPARAEDAAAARAAACAQATSDLERHDLGCPDDEPQRASPDNDVSD